MRVFTNQPLRKCPHIAIIGPNKVGGFVLLTPLLRGLKEKYSNCTIDYFGSPLTEEFESGSRYIDWRVSATKNLVLLKVEIQKRELIFGKYDVAINCDSFNSNTLRILTLICSLYVVGSLETAVFSSDLEYEIQEISLNQEWNSLDFLKRHSKYIKTNYISEIFCRISFVDTDFTHLEVPQKEPGFSVPDVLIHVTASRPAKQWLEEYWKIIIQWCESNNFSIGLIGSNPNTQKDLYYSKGIEENLLDSSFLVDLRGKTSLPELAGALAVTKVFVTIDTGPLHIAAAIKCRTIAVFGNNVDGIGASPIRLWGPPQAFVQFALSKYSCSLCEEARFKNNACFLKAHYCMIHVSPNDVISQLTKILLV